MKKVGVAILGVGVVGGGTYKTLLEHREFYKQTQNVDLSVETVLVHHKQKAIDQGIPEEMIASSIAEVVANPNVDIVVETIGGCDVAKEYILAALRQGKSVVTANKELICKFSHELEREAKRNSCGLYYEASCVGGVPVIRTLYDGLQANHVTHLMGVINGTTNYILTQMSQSGAKYEDALKEAQRLGYAELDPSADVDGLDATYKLSILASMAFHTKVPYTKIFREGIAKLHPADILYGKELGYTLKLLAIGKNTENGVEARVHPTLIPSDHPLAAVSNDYNAVFLRGDAVGDVMLYGRGAGEFPTASAVVSDIIYAATHSDFKYSTFKNTAGANPETKFINNFESEYYIRLSVTDEVGILAKIMVIFAKYNVSIVKVAQQNKMEETGDRIPLIILTHTAKENAVKNAVAKINATGVCSVESVLRMER